MASPPDKSCSGVHGQAVQAITSLAIAPGVCAPATGTLRNAAAINTPTRLALRI
jgi:hypothetical protein